MNAIDAIDAIDATDSTDADGRPCLVVSIDLLQQSIAVALHTDQAVPHAIDATDATDAMTP